MAGPIYKATDTRRRVDAVDGKTWGLVADHTDCVVRVQTGNNARLPDWSAQLSPRDARLLADLLLAAAHDLDRGPVSK